MWLNSLNWNDENVEKAKAAINANPNERLISSEEIAAWNVRMKADEESAQILSEKIKWWEEISLEDLLNQTMIDIPNIRLLNLWKDIPEWGKYNIYIGDELVLEWWTDDTVDVPIMNFEWIKPWTKMKVDFLDANGDSVLIDEQEL